MLNAAGNWQHTFEGLAVYDSTDGHEITYTVTEEAVRGYTTKITGDVETGFLVTNTSVVTPPTPKTGDDSNLQLYLGLMLASGGAMVWLLAQKKKNKEE
jgi:LPXTG-motif cell wall-anchored protein